MTIKLFLDIIKSRGVGFLDIIFSLFFVVFLIAFVVILGKNIAQWFKNNNSPRLSVNATVVAKRTDISHHHDTNGVSGHSASYYVTFQVESGDRIELYVPDNEFGYLVEGDVGVLRFQGTRYLGFDRT